MRSTLHPSPASRGPVDNILHPTLTPFQHQRTPATASQHYNGQANGASITTFGRIPLTMDLGLQQNLWWVFLIAKMQQPTIGYDFLDFLRHSSLSTTATRITPHIILIAPWSSTALTDPLAEFSDITSPVTNTAVIKHSITNHIDASGPPTFAKPRRLYP